MFMNRLKIHQQICRSIDEQLSLKWPQDPSQGADRACSLDIVELFYHLEYLFEVRPDLNRNLRGITPPGHLSRFIHEKTRPIDSTLLGTVPALLPPKQQKRLNA